METIVCGGCGKVRELKYKLRARSSGNCLSCGQKNRVRKGMHSRNNNGYIRISLLPNNKFYPMTNKRGELLEHRYVIAKSLDMCLEKWEVVHHINGIRDDNRIENLQLLSSIGEHAVDALLKSRLKQLESRVLLLEMENILLHKQLGDMCNVRTEHI
jgi:hypothetical protein